MGDPRPLVARGDYPRKFAELERFFEDEAACWDYVLQLGWPGYWGRIKAP